MGGNDPLVAICTGIPKALGTFIAMHHVMVAQQSFYVIGKLGGSGDMATTAISPHAHACSVAVHCNRVLLVLCLAKTGACYLAAVASQSRRSIPGSALYDQCRFDNSGIATPSAATVYPYAQAMYTNAL